MPEEEVLEEANFCTACRYLEDPVEMGDNSCQSCGCTKGDHVTVKVVKTGEVV